MQLHILKRFAFTAGMLIPATVAGLVFYATWQLTQLEIWVLDEGVTSPYVAFVASVVYVFWFRDRILYALSLDAGRYRMLSRDMGLSLAAFCAFIVGGRVLFSFFWPWSGAFGSIVGLIAAFKLLPYLVEYANVGPFAHSRGTTLTSQGEAERRIRELRNSGAGRNQTGIEEPHIMWANLRLPPSVAQGNFCVVGVPGSGKTLMHRELMESVLPTIVPATGCRAMIYDVKGDLISHLYAMRADPALVLMLDPFDARSFAWDIAHDQLEPDDAIRLANVIVAKDDQRNPYFQDASREILKGVIDVLMLNHAGKWTLRDLINITADIDVLRSCLLSSVYSKSIVSKHFTAKDTLSNVLTTLGLAMDRLSPVAAIWHRNTARSISLREWCFKGGSTLVITRQADHKDTAVAINRVMFQYIAAMLLKGPEAPTENRTWFFCDELLDAGQLDGLVELLNDGRSKGIRSVLGLQDLDGMERVYHGQGTEIPDKIKNISFLKITNIRTAEWASKRIGQTERWEPSVGESTNKDKETTTSTNESLHLRDAVLPSELGNLPEVKDGFVTGFHKLSTLDLTFRSTFGFQFHKKEPDVDFQPHPDSSIQRLEPWNTDDAARLPFTSVGRQAESNGAESVPFQPTKSDPNPSRYTPLHDVGRIDVDH